MGENARKSVAPIWVQDFAKRIEIEGETEDFIHGAIDGYHYFANQYAKWMNAVILKETSLQTSPLLISEEDVTKIAEEHFAWVQSTVLRTERVRGFIGGYIAHMQITLRKEQKDAH